jgi:hypothetical protein
MKHILMAIIASVATFANAAEISFELDKPGNVSAAVYDTQGRLLRELQRGLPMASGKHTLQWDGLDRNGVAQAPGDYTWKLLRTPGFEAKFLGMVGITTVEQPYDPWVGNNDGPSAVACDETGWYVGSVASECIPPFRKQSADGKKRLWQKDAMEAWQGPNALASENGTLFVLQQNGKVIPMDAGTSTHKTYGDDLGKLRPVAWDVLAPGDNRNGLGGQSTGPMDMDAAGEQFAVSSEKFNLVSWYSSKPLTIASKTDEKKLKELSDAQILRKETVPAPKGVAMGADGVTYVISEGTVLAIGKDKKVFIPAGQMENPYRLAFDKKNGDLLVAEGAPDHQIKRFDRNGKITATYGRKGGRIDGPFIATDFLNIRDIVATKDGGFLICEGNESLRRTAQFDRTGKLVGQWFGGSPYYNVASSTPEKPNEIWFYAGYATLGVAKMDFENRTWELTASYMYNDYGDGLFPKHNPFKYWHVRQRNGVTYLVNDKSAVLRLDPEKKRLMPVAISGWAIGNHVKDRSKAPKPWLDAVAAQKLDANKCSTAYTWSDLNCDGEFQPEEFRLGGDAMGGGVGHCFIDEKWNLYFGVDGDGTKTPWVRLPNLAAKTAAAPLWDWNKMEPANAQWPDEIKAMGGIETRGIWRDDTGATYQFIAANRAPTMDRHGVSFPGFRNGATRVIKWNADGTLAWCVGKHSNLDTFSGATPGEYHDPTRILGITHDCLVVADRSGMPATVLTSDGLYAGSFLDRRADDGLPARVYAWWREKRPIPGKPGEFENPHTMSTDTPIPYDIIGGFMLTLPDGEVLWMPMGENATAVYRMSGWKDWERLQGQIKLVSTPQHAAAAGTGLSAEYFNNLNLEGAPAHTRLDSRIWLGHKIDRAKWLPWSKPPVPGIGEKNFSARWTGFLEPQLSEAYTFSAYIGSKDHVRLWIGDQLAIDAWAVLDPKRRRPKVTAGIIDEVVSKPVALTAGKRVPIRLEYVSEGPEQGSLSLNWDSQTQERQRIPTACLYPGKL